MPVISFRYCCNIVNLHPYNREKQARMHKLDARFLKFNQTGPSIQVGGGPEIRQEKGL